MDIIVSEKSLRRFLKTPVKIEDIIKHLSNCGPTVDRSRKTSDDTILEIEAITNRVDSASVFGVAREANAILSQNKLVSSLENNPYLNKKDTHGNQTSNLNFSVSDKKLVKRFTAVAIDGVEVKPSPKEIISLLENAGQRPINNLVDATNESTLLYGIPSHVFDKDKLALQKLRIREANQNEAITTLDDEKLALQGGEIVIEDGQGRLVDLCGVMGGQIAVVDEHTKNIVLIVPIYNPGKIRKASMTHQKRTLAAQIYEKGPDDQLTLPVLNLLNKAIIERAGGKISSKIFDLNNNNDEQKKVSLNLNWLDNFTGVTIPREDITSILENLGFSEISISKDTLTTTIPSFRYQDINIREDLAEEITRIYGYYNIPGSLPPLNKTPKQTDNIFELERKIKEILVAEGYSEVYNSSLISGSLIETVKQDQERFLRLQNCLSEDLEYLRTSLIPSALQNHLNNKGKSTLPIKLFELANIYLPIANKQLPNEVSTLVISSYIKVLELKSVLEKLFILLNLSSYQFQQPAKSQSEFLDDQNSADIILDGQNIGQIGEVKVSITRSFNLTGIVSVAELNISSLNLIKPKLRFDPISEYPNLKENITLTSTNQIGEIIKKISSTNQDIKSVKFIESFKENHTFEIIIGSSSKNLTQEDANNIKKEILSNFL